MKTPLILSVLILALGSVIGWKDHQRLVSARAAHGEAVTEAGKRGISVESNNGTTTARVTKRAREDHEATARLLTADYIGFTKEKEALRSQGEEPGEEFQIREMEFHDRMKSLDSGQWKVFINEVCSCTELQSRTRQGFLYHSISIFAHSHPEAALAFLAEAPELFSGSGKAEHLISTALIGWSKNDPVAALNWFRKNGPAHPHGITEYTKRQMVTRAAFHDPHIAFSLIDGLEIAHTSAVILELMGSASTPEMRTTTLAALRAHLESIEDEENRKITATSGVLTLAHQVFQEGFGPASQWIAAADLTPRELSIFADILPSTSQLEETGQWLEWGVKNLPPAKADAVIRGLIRRWTTHDYQAAGKWLGITPEGPTKNTAIASYAETVASYEPETAAQWALTLPPGTDRERTLKTIHRNWPKDDPEGAAAFAKKLELE